jgi:hypothetical protein
MSAISLRLPNSIHARVRNLAKYDGVSVNQFITVALTEKLSVMNAAEYKFKSSFTWCAEPVQRDGLVARQ